MARDEVEAAYFTLLRARSDLEALHRYAEYLDAERRRLHRTQQEQLALADGVDRKVRRVFAASDDELAQAMQQRMALIDDEYRHLPDRVAAATAFVDECEQLHQTLAAQQPRA